MSELTLEAIERLLDRRFSSLEERLNKRLEQSEQRVEKRFAGIDQRFDQVDKRFSGIDQRFDQVMEVVEFIRDNSVHRDEFKFELKALEERIAKKFAEQSVSLAFIESQISSLRKDLDRLAERTRGDTSALTKEYLKLKARVELLEKMVKQKFKPA